MRKLNYRQSGLYRLSRQLLFTTLMAMAFAASASSAEPIKVIVPIPPGGALDIMARVLAEQISRAHGPAMIVENRPGADTMIGTDLVARAAPDGKTLLIAGTGLVINPLLRKTNYNPLTSFAPICELAVLPTVVAVNSKSPYRTLADLFEDARAKPGQLTLASIGPASTAHVAFEQLKREAKVDITFVSYPGTAPAFDAVLGQHVTAYLGEASFVAAQAKAGTLRALAAASSQRLELLPDVPTLQELGFTDVMGQLWLGVLAPAKTAKEMTDRLAAYYSAALQMPEVKTKLGALGLYPTPACGDEFKNFIRQQFEEYGRVIHQIGIRAD
jgi:tripartite-type tricarboxylate transporter receptor subunit TctC